MTLSQHYYWHPRALTLFCNSADLFCRRSSISTQFTIWALASKGASSQNKSELWHTDLALALCCLLSCQIRPSWLSQDFCQTSESLWIHHAYLKGSIQPINSATWLNNSEGVCWKYMKMGCLQDHGQMSLAEFTEDEAREQMFLSWPPSRSFS